MRNIDRISESNNQEVAEILARLLADEFVLYTKILRVHWNIEGHDFHATHLFFEDHYNLVNKITDDVAEQIKRVGYNAPASLDDFLELTQLTKNHECESTCKDFIAALLEDHEAIILYIRNNILKIEADYKDAETTNYLTRLLQDHEEMAWMLRASIPRVLKK